MKGLSSYNTTFTFIDPPFIAGAPSSISIVPVI